MPADADKVMFAIYRETGFNRRYRVVYFTELDEDRRDAEINAMLSGDPIYEGFLDAKRGAEAKEAISRYLTQLNGGDAAAESEAERLLGPFLHQHQP